MKENTGWELKRVHDAQETLPPSEAELAALYTIDKDGFAGRDRVATQYENLVILRPKEPVDL